MCKSQKSRYKLCAVVVVAASSEPDQANSSNRNGVAEGEGAMHVQGSSDPSESVCALGWRPGGGMAVILTAFRSHLNLHTCQSSAHPRPRSLACLCEPLSVPLPSPPSIPQKGSVRRAHFLMSHRPVFPLPNFSQ